MRLEDLEGKRIFDVDLSLNRGDTVSCRIAIDQSVIDRALEKDFTECLFDLKNAEGVASYLARAMGIGNYCLNDLEGFYGLDSRLVKFLIYPEIEWETYAVVEIDPKTLNWSKEVDD